MAHHILVPGDTATLHVTARRALTVTAEGWNLRVQSTDGIVLAKVGDSNCEGLTICCGGEMEDDEV